MKLHLLAVGTKMPSWVTESYEEYAKRLPRDCSLHLHEIMPAKRGKSGSPTQWMREEGERILAAIPANHYVIALDVKGKTWTTQTLSEQFEQWQHDGRDVSLIIGGADGLAAECLQRADQKWSLSALTFPHPIVRVVLAEQLYRAWTILQNHPYHRA